MAVDGLLEGAFLGAPNNHNWPGIKVYCDFVSPGSSQPDMTQPTELASAGGLSSVRFDTGINNWTGVGATAAYQTNPSFIHDGSGSMAITVTTASAPGQLAHNTSNNWTVAASGLIIGKYYSITCWVLVPVGSTPVYMQVGGNNSATAPADGQWHQLSAWALCTSSSGFGVSFWCPGTPVASSVVYVDTIVCTNAWTDITSRVRRVGTGQLMHTERGRNYERAQTDAGTCTFVLDNSDGLFDSTNTASVYYPNVKPIRKLWVVCTWAGITYNLFYGFVEEWPRTWSKSGYWGEVNATARGVLSSLANVILDAHWVAAAIDDNASCIYRMNDQSGSTNAANASSYQQEFAVAVPSSVSMNPSNKYGFGSNAGFGNLAGDPSNSLTLTPTSDSSNTSTNGRFNQGGWYLQTANSSDGSAALFLFPGQSWSFECWFQALPNSGGGAARHNPLLNQNSSGTNLLNLVIESASTSASAPGIIQFTMGTATTLSTNSSTNYWDGLWHQVVITATPSGTNTILTMYVDGVVPTGSGAVGTVTASDLSLNQGSITNQQIGWDGTFPFNGSIKNAAWFGQALTAAQVLNHFNAGGGYPGDDAGARIGRLLSNVPYPNYALDTGDSFMNASDVETKNLTQAIQDINDTEVGTIVERADGFVVFKNRNSRGGAASVATFGEDGFPYEDGLTIQQDPKEVYTAIQVSRNYGGSITNLDTTATADYFSRTLQLTTYDNTEQQMVYLSQYMLGRYKVARDRIPNLTLNPASNPLLWPQVLGREIGDRVTVTRQNPGAPPITEDFYIDKITHDIQVGQWTTTWMLSSSSLYDTWVLGDPVLGVLGSTTVLGF